MGSRNEIRAEKEWEDMNYTYILKCSDETLYTGWTNDLEKRINAHNAGKGAKYTKNRRPVELAYYEEFATKEEAMSREYAIKQLTRRKKEELIKKDTPEYNLGRSILQKCYVPNLYISIHYDIVAEASAHYEQVEDFMASEVFMPVVEDGKF